MSYTRRPAHHHQSVYLSKYFKTVKHCSFERKPSLPHHCRAPSANSKQPDWPTEDAKGENSSREALACGNLCTSVAAAGVGSGVRGHARVHVRDCSLWRCVRGPGCVMPYGATCLTSFDLPTQMDWAGLCRRCESRRSWAEGVYGRAGGEYSKSRFMEPCPEEDIDTSK